MSRFIFKKVIDSIKSNFWKSTPVVASSPPISAKMPKSKRKAAKVAPNVSGSQKSSSAAASSTELKNPLVWIDMEMTGLDVSKDRVMEIACLVTDGELNIKAEFPSHVIHQEDQLLDTMDPWCIQQHGKTGLTQACRDSTLTEKEVEDKVIEFLQKHVKEGQSPLAGNTVYMDRKFLTQYMPRIDKFLHYRLVDVSSVKELCRMWYPEEYSKAPRKGGSHRALDDIKESVKELRYYRTAVFKHQ